MDYGKYVNINLVGKKILKDGKENGVIVAFDGRSVIDVKFENEPEIFLKIKGFEKRKGTKFFGVFNEPTGYGEKSETYVFLDSDLSKNYPPQRKGNIVSAVVNEWDVETGRTGVPKIRFQLSNGGVWCMPIHYW